MSFTFKKFLQIVESDELSEDQLFELFGTFKNNKKIDDLKAKRDALRSKQTGKDDTDWNLAKKIANKKTPLTPAEKEAIKKKMWADAKFRTSDSPISVRENKAK